MYIESIQSLISKRQLSYFLHIKDKNCRKQNKTKNCITMKVEKFSYQKANPIKKFNTNSTSNKNKKVTMIFQSDTLQLKFTKQKTTKISN